MSRKQKQSNEGILYTFEMTKSQTLDELDRIEEGSENGSQRNRKQTRLRNERWI